MMSGIAQLIFALLYWAIAIVIVVYVISLLKRTAEGVERLDATLERRLEALSQALAQSPPANDDA